MRELELPQNLYFEFIKRHNDVICPHLAKINPYYLGFKIFQDIEKRYGIKKIFEVRALERDYSFIRKYLTKELCVETNLFQFGQKGSDYLIEEVSDEIGWREIRNSLSSDCSMGSIPVIKIIDLSSKDYTLTLQHVYDGRELQINYAQTTLKHLQELWGYDVELQTIISNKEVTIKCQ